MSNTISYQIGKKGLTKEFIEGLAKKFKKPDLIKISVMNSALRDREALKAMDQNLCSELKALEKKDFTYKAIGYTLVIKKWRKTL